MHSDIYLGIGLGSSVAAYVGILVLSVFLRRRSSDKPYISTTIAVGIVAPLAFIVGTIFPATSIKNLLARYAAVPSFDAFLVTFVIMLFAECVYFLLVFLGLVGAPAALSWWDKLGR